MDIIRRAAGLVDNLVVGIGRNPGKLTHLLSMRDRAALLKQLVPKNVEVLSFEGLLVDFAAQVGATLIVRGIRGPQDVDWESAQCQTNRLLGDLETVLLFAKEEYRHLSSSLVRESIHNKNAIEKMVPPEVLFHLTRC